MTTNSRVLILLLSISIYFQCVVVGLRYEPTQSSWNLNQNQSATEPLDYWGEWQDHEYMASPENWRIPFYTITLDRYVNGDPTNDEANGTHFEHDWMSNQFRFGGDARGLANHLDYIQGIGIRAIYLMGSPFINLPWSGDGYSPLDLTLLDHHHGTIEDWRTLVTAIHARGMYVVMDNTMATMGDLLGFAGYANATAPFTWSEYDYFWKTDRHYLDFQPGDGISTTCKYPRYWDNEGYPLNNLSAVETQCRESEFSLYGDLAGTGGAPVWQNQLAKYDSVQDRLREWRTDVLDKIMHFSCIQIAMLDLDGFRMDKALQTSIDALGEFSNYQRQCAKDFGKDNFFIIGEVVGTDALSSVYFGRGKEPGQYATDITKAASTTNTTNDVAYIRQYGLNALDATAFHYTTYGALTRLLGLDGAIGEDGVDFVSFWRKTMLQDDLVNANTGVFDPRHLYGATNQDVFRWPALEQGTERQLLAHFVTFLIMPGVPQLYYGEEQGFSVLDSTSPDYVYGRQPMSSNRAWHTHGCYSAGYETYVDFPLGPALHACHTDESSRDSKNPSHPVHNVVKRMFELRRIYPTLNDGYYLKTLSSHTQDTYLLGSNGIPTPFGIWSIYRSALDGVQDLNGIGQGNQGVWLVYSNKNVSETYSFDCADETLALVSPFAADITVKNLFYPYEEYVLENSTQSYGCLSTFSMGPYGFKALVPQASFVTPVPVITGVVPSHDARIVPHVQLGQQQNISIEIHFSSTMDCESVAGSVTVESTTQDEVDATLALGSASCTAVAPKTTTSLVGEPATVWKFSAVLQNVSHGIHTFTVNNASTLNGSSTNTVDRFLFRIGEASNPLVFPAANYSSTLLRRNSTNGGLFVTPNAAGADKVRYSTTWGSTWSSWLNYTGENITLVDQAWSGTGSQKWKGEHVILQFWSRATGSAEYFQHGGIDEPTQRRWPHAFVLGGWNEWGYDNGLASSMNLVANGSWELSLAVEWPTNTTVNIWGINPDGSPDKTMQYGDVDEDGILDWLHPDTLETNIIKLSDSPGWPYAAWKLTVHDGTYGYSIRRIGSAWHHVFVAILLSVIPILSAIAAVWVFKTSFYEVKVNLVGMAAATGLPSVAVLASFMGRKHPGRAALATTTEERRRKVLIATMEYEIEDWEIKIKIGGLGVMASLMGKALGHQNLIWVVPCVGGIDYPVDTPAEPMIITVNGCKYQIQVQYHSLRNITFVLLDAPVFRLQNKAVPYPARMDDLDSAVYYSAWNACIAEAIKRFNPDIYQINDYHGSLAPLYLLPEKIPVSLSLHNSEFQGLWSLRSAEEMSEISMVFNLPKDVIRKYVQFGEVFNLLHAGASYLRIHQKGYGAVGVSKKYGLRALKRYPIFWGLGNIGSLPNPDPADMDEWDGQLPDPRSVVLDEEAEAARGDLRLKAQHWAGLEPNANAQLFVFVGRWSQQKGVDLIADVFPALLNQHPDVQLICIGPLIDLYGKFAALKLAKMMQVYPGRVYSKPEFVALPPFLFSGAEFALIPSRDEPFGLVAVEFGRKGALGVGSRVGGLGQMPGWWYPIESMAPKHLILQFKAAIEAALASSQETRALMRARSSIQRFPVAQWVKDLETLQSTSIKVHHEAARSSTLSLSMSGTGFSTPILSALTPTALSIAASSRAASPDRNRLSRVTRYFESESTTPNGFSPMPSTAATALSTAAPTRAPSPERRPVTSGRSSGTATPVNGRVVLKHSLGNLLGSRLMALAEDESRSENPNGVDGDNDGVTSVRGCDPSCNRDSKSSSTDIPSSEKAGETLGPKNLSTLTLSDVAGGRADLKLQNVDQFFTDPSGHYYSAFERQLDKHLADLSSDKLCVEECLKKSEKDWFGKVYNAKIAKIPTKDFLVTQVDDFQLNHHHTPPTLMKRWLQRKIGDWPSYSFLLALGQILAANSYQVTLLMGQNGQTADRLYIISSIFLGATMFWWLLSRYIRSFLLLSLPFFLYGLAFFFLGITPYTGPSVPKAWVQNTASALYAFASASGFLYFTQNFGTEGGTAVRSWIFRACMIQGVQQIYIAALWYWGNYTSSLTNSGNSMALLTTTSRVVTPVAMPVAVLLWVVGAALFAGLPAAYRSQPGTVPALYKSIFRRKVIVWFMVVVGIQNFWLSGPYGRNWSYLWSSTHAPAWGVAILVLFFFVGVWAIMMYGFAKLSDEHSWALPLFAIGLGAPRWAQELWGTSSMGLYIPWVLSGGSNSTARAVGALVGRGIWLWLGVLDTIQGVGFGMILMQTLTRVHMSGAIACAQIVGSAFTILARAKAPDATGPGPVFPNLAVDFWGGISDTYFWIALLMQLIAAAGFFVFFRKEQLFKP